MFYARGVEPLPESRQRIALRCRYRTRGKIVSQGAAGDANAVSMMTLGLGEIFMIPMAISETRPDGSVVNEFDVWYSTRGTVLAYRWEWHSDRHDVNGSSR